MTSRIVTSSNGTAVARDASGSAPTPQYDPNAPSSEEVIATITAVPRTGRVASATGEAPISCTVEYDYPHPATSTGKTTINAHLTAKCDYYVPSISVASQMCHANGDTCGTIDTKTRYATNYAQTGGDLACGPLSRAYQAFGSVDIEFPPNYTPPNYIDFLASQKRWFQKVGGICVAS
ncbi:hypothetical protein [Nocardioides maradonensis]